MASDIFYAATFDLTSCIAIAQSIWSFGFEPRTPPALETLKD
jgi:hypothetical protein